MAALLDAVLLSRSVIALSRCQGCGYIKTKKLCLSAKWEQLSLAITHCLLSPSMNGYKVLGDLPMQNVTYKATENEFLLCTCLS